MGVPCKGRHRRHRLQMALCDDVLPDILKVYSANYLYFLERFCHSNAKIPFLTSRAGFYCGMVRYVYVPQHCAVQMTSIAHKPYQMVLYRIIHQVFISMRRTYAHLLLINRTVKDNSSGLCPQVLRTNAYYFLYSIPDCNVGSFPWFMIPAFYSNNAHVFLTLTHVFVQ